MKVAFDCKGTLLGREPKVVKLFKWFQKCGAEMFIWSNSYGYTQDAQKLHGLTAECMMKRTKWDLETCVNPEEEMMDIAVDDEDQEYLAAKNFILVRDIPEDEADFPAKYNHFFYQT